MILGSIGNPHLLCVPNCKSHDSSRFLESCRRSASASALGAIFAIGPAIGSPGSSLWRNIRFLATYINSVRRGHDSVTSLTLHRRDVALGHLILERLRGNALYVNRAMPRSLIHYCMSCITGLVNLSNVPHGSNSDDRGSGILCVWHLICWCSRPVSLCLVCVPL